MIYRMPSFSPRCLVIPSIDWTTGRIERRRPRWAPRPTSGPGSAATRANVLSCDAAARLRRLLRALGVSLVVPILPIAAQSAIPIQPNQRVRISAPTRQLASAVALFVSQDRDSLTVHLVKRNQTITLGMTEIHSLEASQRSRTHALQGAMVGLLVGGVLGVATSLDSECRSEQDDPFGLNCVGQAAGGVIGGGVGGGLLGLLAGAVVGKWIRTEEWHSIGLTAGTSTFVYQIHGRTLGRVGVRIPF